MVGIDLDRHQDHQDHQDGVASFAAVLAEYGGASWPDTLTVRTPGGLHVYFRAGGRALPSTSGGRSGLGAGVDTRAPGRRWGGYLVGPGSVVAGRGYVLENDTPILDLPPWLAAVLTGPRPGSRRPRAGPRARAGLPR